MEKLVVSMLLIGCFKLQQLPLADALVVGVVHDPLDIDSGQISAVLQRLEGPQGLQHPNITFLVIPVSEDSDWTVCQLVNSSILALVAIADCRFQSYLSLRTESHLPLPLIVVGVGTPCPNVAWDGRVFVGTNRYHWLPHAVGDVLAFLETSQLMIVYSEEFVQVTSDTTHYLSTVHVKSAVMTVDEFLDPHLDNRLHVLRSDVNASVTVFIAVSRTDAELIMSQYGANTDHWLIFTGGTPTSGSESLKSFQFFFQPRVPMPISERRLYSHEMGPADDILQLITAAIQQIQKSPNFNPLDAETTCGHLNVTVPSGAGQLMEYLSQHVFDDHGYLKVDHYGIIVSTPDGVHSAGAWNVSMGLTMPPKLTSTFSPHLLVTNRTLIVGAEMSPPFVLLENGTWKGFCVDMLDELAFRMDFRYKLIRSVDKLYGGINPDGTWNGLVGMAIRKEIDMAIGPISVTAEREKVVDFTKPYMESAAGLLMRRFEDTNAKMFRTLMPFTFNVWLTLAGLVILVGVVFAFINKFSPAKSKPGEGSVDRWIDSVWDSVWVVFGSFMEQGAERFPRSVAGRVVLGLWWVFTILTTASYTASLAAFLTFSMAHVPINSIYDLAEQSQVLPLVKNGTNLYTLFNKGETAMHRRIYEMMQQAPEARDTQQAMDLVMSGPYALLSDREQLDLLQKRDCQSLVQGKEHFNNNGLAFFVQEGNALLEPLSNNIIKMMESGLIDKWRRTWWSAKDVCSVEVAMSSVQSLKLDTTAGPFIIYACSTMLAVIILMSERAVNSLWPICKAMLARRATEV